jgi:hypothetical protein
MHAKLFGGRYDVGEVEKIVSLLANHGYLRRVVDPPGQRPGRPRGPRFEVHPCVWGPRQAAGDEAGKRSQSSQYSQKDPAVGAKGSFVNSVDIVNAPQAVPPASDPDEMAF